MGEIIGFKVEQENIDPLLDVLEYLSNEVITIVDSNEIHHHFRKFLFSSNWGVADGNGKFVIVPALPNYSQLEFLLTVKVIIAGAFFAGWDVYSLDGEKLDHLPPMPLALSTKLVKDKFSRN